MSPLLSPGQCWVPAPMCMVPQEVMPGLGPALARMFPSPPPPPPAPMSVPVAWTWLSFPLLDFLSEIPEVCTQPVMPCTPLFEIKLKIRSVPLFLYPPGCSLPVVPDSSPPHCRSHSGRQWAGLGEFVSSLQNECFYEQVLHLQGHGAHPCCSSAGLWVWLHPLLDNGARLVPAGLSQGCLLSTQTADWQC